MDWWNTTCVACLKIRQGLLELFNLLSILLALGIILFAALGAYWLWWDTAPIIYSGPNGRAEFVDGNVIFHLDAVRLRGCPDRVRRKISGCGQIDIPETDAVTPVGLQVPPVSIPLTTITQRFTAAQLSGNVSVLISIVEGYCNPAQAFFKMPIHNQSLPIAFIPVPRAKSYNEPPL
jgi:hypothetical protein